MTSAALAAIENVTLSASFCNITEFSKSYQSLHGYLSLFVCIFGSVTNILNICVLTTREMRWPTNLILTGLAVADLLVMLEYIPFACHSYVNNDAKKTASYFSYPWAVYMYFHAVFSQVGHFISCCLTVILAIWRYVSIAHPRSNKLRQTVTSIPKTLLTIFTTYLTCPLFCLPLLVTTTIKVETKREDIHGLLIPDKQVKNYTDVMRNATVYRLDLAGSWHEATLLIYGLLLKLVPCILLSILSLKIILVLLETKKRRRQLMINSGVPMVHIDGRFRSVNQKKQADKELQTDRTTKMLLTVLLLFLITEFPQAILALLSIIYGAKFAKQCYHPLGDLMDILALTNSAINFVLYCSMSRQFRSAFREVFGLKVCNHWIPVPQTPIEHNGATTQVTLV